MFHYEFAERAILPNFLSCQLVDQGRGVHLGVEGCCSWCFEVHRGSCLLGITGSVVEQAISVKGLWSIVLNEGLYLKKNKCAMISIETSMVKGWWHRRSHALLHNLLR
jgi:hypothetical protein